MEGVRRRRREVKDSEQMGGEGGMKKWEEERH